MSEPTRQEAADLTAAAQVGFGPCNCMLHDDHTHQCAGHAFMCEDPTRRMGIKVWQRLLWMRSQRAKLLEQEALKAPEPALDPTRLPW